MSRRTRSSASSPYHASQLFCVNTETFAAFAVHAVSGKSVDADAFGRIVQTGGKLVGIRHDRCDRRLDVDALLTHFLQRTKTSGNRRRLGSHLSTHVFPIRLHGHADTHPLAKLNKQIGVTHDERTARLHPQKIGRFIAHGLQQAACHLLPVFSRLIRVGCRRHENENLASFLRPPQLTGKL